MSADVTTRRWVAAYFTRFSYASQIARCSSRGRSRESNSHRRTDKFGRSEGVTCGNGRPDGRRVSRPLSRFTYEACLEHAIRKQEAGEPIRSVGGLANHFYWTGEQDEEIAQGLG